MKKLDKITQTRLETTSVVCYLLTVLFALGTTCEENILLGPSLIFIIWNTVIGWYWVVIKTVYLLGVWCGLRLLIQAENRKEPKVLILGVISILAVIGSAVGGILIATSESFVKYIFGI